MNKYINKNGWWYPTSEQPGPTFWFRLGLRQGTQRENFVVLQMVQSPNDVQCTIL